MLCFAHGLVTREQIEQLILCQTEACGGQIAQGSCDERATIALWRLQPL